MAFMPIKDSDQPAPWADPEGGGGGGGGEGSSDPPPQKSQKYRVA